jgi:hypothetical protein
MPHFFIFRCNTCGFVFNRTADALTGGKGYVADRPTLIRPFLLARTAQLRPSPCARQHGNLADARSRHVVLGCAFFLGRAGQQLFQNGKHVEGAETKPGLGSGLPKHWNVVFLTAVIHVPDLNSRLSGHGIGICIGGTHGVGDFLAPASPFVMAHVRYVNLTTSLHVSHTHAKFFGYGIDSVGDPLTTDSAFMICHG